MLELGLGGAGMQVERKMDKEWTGAKSGSRNGTELNGTEAKRKLNGMEMETERCGNGKWDGEM